MRRSGAIRAVILTALSVLVVSGTGIILFNHSNISPQFVNGVGAVLSAVVLAVMVGMDALFVVLIAGTPRIGGNRELGARRSKWTMLRARSTKSRSTRLSAIGAQD